MIKKEFGKPKSVTKRSSREYQNGDKDICEAVVEEAKPKFEETPEMTELNRKIEILESDMLGIYKVTFSKNDVISDSSQYIFAEDTEDVYNQVRMCADRDGIVDPDIIVSKIKSVLRMTGNAIKMDKGCLKHLARYSLEELEEMYSKCEEIEEKSKQESIKKYLELLDKGFELYVGKTEPKGKMYFAELARSEEEANALVLTEDRVAKQMMTGDKIKGINIGKVEEINKKSEKYKKLDAKKDAEMFVEEIKSFSQKKDLIYKFLFGKTPVENYIKYVDGVIGVLKGVKEGKGEEMLRVEAQKISENLDAGKLTLEALLKGRNKRLGIPFKDDKFLRSL
jgi:hypothetical protein